MIRVTLKNGGTRGRIINEILKTLGAAYNFNFVPDLSCHSFRRGLSTSAAREHVDFELNFDKTAGRQFVVESIRV